MVFVIKFIVDLSFCFVVSLNVFLVLDLDHSFFETAPVRLELPELVEIFIPFLKCLTSRCHVMKNDVFVLHQVAALRPQNCICCASQEILHGHLLEHFGVEVSLNDQASELTFLETLFEDVLLYCVNRNKAVDMDCFSLANPMASILSLLVHGWVPIGIVENDAVRACQVNANATASSGRYEAEDLLVQVELVD